MCEEHVIFVRSIRDWVSAIVKDPVLFPHFQWHPIRKYHIFGEREVQYIDEPWSGQEWWEDQVCTRHRSAIAAQNLVLDYA